MYFFFLSYIESRRYWCSSLLVLVVNGARRYWCSSLMVLVVTGARLSWRHCVSASVLEYGIVILECVIDFGVSFWRVPHSCCRCHYCALLCRLAGSRFLSS